MKIYIGCATATVFVLFILVGDGVAVRAHSGSTGVVKERMELMERFNELMDRVFAMLRGEIPYDAATVRKAAKEIEQSSGAKLVALFPKGSAGEPSDARAEIWRDFDRFRHYAERMGGIAADLAAQASTPGAGKSLPRKWESVTMGGGMMGGGPMGRGGMMRGGMMHGSSDAAAAASHLAAMCNACHAQFRKEK